MSRISAEVLRLLASLALLVLVSAPRASAQDGPPPPPQGISIETLLAEGGDVAGLARTPAEPYRLDVFTRTSEPEQRKRGRRTEFVLASMVGPGAIVGIWMARPEGELRVYVDGSALPAVQVECELAFTGRMTFFPPPTSGRTAAGGRLLYPIPFAKSIEVTCDRDVDFEVVGRRYTGEKVVVVPFAANAAAQAFFTARDSLANWADMPSPPPVPRVEGRNEMEPSTSDVELEPGAEHVVLSESVEKPRAVTRFAVEVVGDPISPDTWARIRVMIVCDGVPCVDVPLAEFLGGTSEFTPNATLLSRAAIRAGGLVRWRGIRLPMPYRASIEIVVRHTGVRPAGLLRFHVERGPWDWDDRSSHLHARQRTTNVEGGTAGVHGLASLPGKGVLVGLGVRAIGGGEPRDSGPGTVLFGDEEKPRILMRTLGRHFFAPGGRTHDSILVHVREGRDFLRWRVLDRIPFENGLALDLAISAPASKGLRLSTTAFWYAMPPD